MHTLRTIHTPRLTLRPFRAEDADDLFAYLSDERVYRFEPGEPLDHDGAAIMAADLARSQAFWAVELTDEGKVIGQVYFEQTKPEHLMNWELGYILSPAYQGNGYASEAAAAVVAYGFRSLQAHRISAHCNPENTASWKLLERIGFRREGWQRRDNFFRRDDQGQPVWIDTLVYARLSGEASV